MVTKPSVPPTSTHKIKLQPETLTKGLNYQKIHPPSRVPISPLSELTGRMIIFDRPVCTLMGAHSELRETPPVKVGFT